MKMFILLATIVIFPMFLSIGVFSVFVNVDDGINGDTRATPIRLLISTILPIIIVYKAKRKKSLSLSGGVAALVTGFMLTLANYCFLASLLCFFYSSSKATRYKESEKKKFDPDFKAGGQRNWMQVLANGVMATELALFYIIDVGCVELPIDFQRNYRASWLAVGVMSALCCANGDTWASELATICTKQSPRLITTMRVVPKGTNGAVTFLGILLSAVGGFVIGLIYCITLWLCSSSHDYVHSPPQWPIILIATLAGLFGSMIDSLIGATFQYSGIHMETGKICECTGENIKHICGLPILDNHSVNLLSTVITACIMPQVAVRLLM